MNRREFTKTIPALMGAIILPSVEITPNRVPIMEVDEIGVFRQGVLLCRTTFPPVTCMEGDVLKMDYTVRFKVETDNDF